ncbi:gp16 [Alphaproteobacteria phage PhiJL001]|uniref:Gp16 n=1 Tax=Alphaproteobacteria phage PhiJL001 TaxID=2681607 RepID=Q5DN89_9CAUD|nr:endolysin; inhibits RNA polymerase [Alphaproteobacteria phage PhiJL001]AAT69492.1 gp16 [Alphaproteobacteria phage PhiJL001]
MEKNPKDIAATSRVPLHLLPHIGRVWGAMACRDGAIKYAPYNWRDKPISMMEYLGALERHIAALAGGEWFSPDTDPPVPHLGHIIATAAILLDAEACGTLIDDRPEKNGAVPQLLVDLREILENMNNAKDTSGGNGTGTEDEPEGSTVPEAEELGGIQALSANGVDGGRVLEVVRPSELPDDLSGEGSQSKG